MLDLLDNKQALGVIESLRLGIPPSGLVRTFTVGREEEIQQLNRRLREGTRGALLLLANYGSGKTHLLRYIREVALEEGYAVSYVVLDAKSGVSFYRMDQIVGAILRNLETPLADSKGLHSFFDAICQEIQTTKTLFWKELTRDGRWDTTDLLDCKESYVALRGWFFGSDQTRNLIENWLYHPELYTTRRSYLYQWLVASFFGNFRDGRSRDYYLDRSQGFADFRSQDCSAAWVLLRDINTLISNISLQGLVLLFDEVEDILNNLRVNQQEEAFHNLFSLFKGRRFTGSSYFAVTPDFQSKCKELLVAKRQLEGIDPAFFDKLVSFRMSPLSLSELEQLMGRIIKTHGLAYQWNSDVEINRREIIGILEKTAATPIADWTRQAVKAIVAELDKVYWDKVYPDRYA